MPDYLSNLVSVKDQEFNSSEKIEKEITKVWDQHTFGEVQSVFHK
jgi:hypothetical protein